MKTPLFSIVIPTYNYANVLPRAINSVVAQNSNSYEILVVNDGSSDDTCEVMKPLIKKHGPRLRYIEKENGGAGSARNFGIEHTTGDFLIFLDADDELEINALQLIQHHLTEEPETRFIIGSHISKDETGYEYLTAVNSFPAEKEKCFIGYFSKKFSVVNGACAFHRDVFNTIRYREDMTNSEDISVFALAFALFPSSRIVRPLAIIYKHEDSLRHVYEFSPSFVPNIVDEIFNEKIMPAKLLSYKKTYAARLYLSQSRSAFLAKNKKNVLYCFHKAITTDPRCLFRLSYLKKYLRSLRL